MAYDEYMAEMLEAGWDWEEANAMWESYDPDCSSGNGSGDRWDAEEWDRD